jgi:NitT/TauT family transport system ATP-binding protein
LSLLHFAEIKKGDISLTPQGHTFAHMDVDERKSLFAKHLLSHIPLVALIKRVLEERTLHQAPFTRFRFELEDFMTEEDANETLRTVIDWGRYAELFAYNEHSNCFNLDNPS